MNSSQFLNFLNETLLRLKQKSPDFFRVLNHAHLVILFIAGVPNLINEMVAFGIVPTNWQSLVPGNVMLWALRIIGFCALWGGFVAKLTVLRPPMAIEEGKIVNITDAQKLPFTAKKEAEIVEKKEAALADANDAPPIT